MIVWQSLVLRFWTRLNPYVHWSVILKKENFWHYFDGIKDGFNLQRLLCDVSFLKFQVEIVTLIILNIINYLKVYLGLGV